MSSIQSDQRCKHGAVQSTCYSCLAGYKVPLSQLEIVAAILDNTSDKEKIDKVTCEHGEIIGACLTCKNIAEWREKLIIEYDEKLSTKTADTMTTVHNTPHYYKNGNNDLYDLFIATYGIELWKRHAEMEAIQYLIRATKKGQYIEDITKAKVILQRIIEECEWHSLEPQNKEE